MEISISTIKLSLARMLGPEGWSDDPAVLAAHRTDWLGRYHGETPMVLFPQTTEQVALIVQYCHQHAIPFVPQGGNTGLVGGATPDMSGQQIILSLKRLDRIRAIDAAGFTATVEAGCILHDLHQRTAEHDLLFPLSLGSEGSCTIGGNIATNAGGMGVLRYGMMRDLVLGLEVVLPDGRMWNGLRALRKDNTGYDLKQIFIGAEGTLGIVTAAVLKLFPRPRHKTTAMIAVADPTAALSLLGTARQIGGDCLSCCEIINRRTIAIAQTSIADLPNPLPEAPWVMLLEWAANDPELDRRVEAVLATEIESSRIQDAVIAQNERQRTDFWRLREGIVEAQRNLPAIIKHDLSLPLASIDDFIHQAHAALSRLCSGVEILIFGHIGDGNLHYNLAPPAEMKPTNFRKIAPGLTEALHDLTQSLQGSFSAEHGIGQARRGEIARYKSAVEIDLMRRLKHALDPGNILNPGKVIPDREES